jgi:hypothetical protein
MAKDNEVINVILYVIITVYCTQLVTFREDGRRHAAFPSKIILILSLTVFYYVSYFSD